MEYFEYKIIFNPEIEIYIKFHSKNNTWIVRMPIFEEIHIESTSFTDVILQVEKFLISKTEIITNTEEKPYIKEVRKSDIVIEYSGKLYLCIYRYNQNYKVITTKMTEKRNLVLIDKVASTKEIDELINLFSNLKIFPSGASGYEGFISNLKIKTNYKNFVNISWWSGAVDSWTGLDDIIIKLNEIYTVNFGTEMDR